LEGGKEGEKGIDMEKGGGHLSYFLAAAKMHLGGKRTSESTCCRSRSGEGLCEKKEKSKELVGGRSGPALEGIYCSPKVFLGGSEKGA